MAWVLMVTKGSKKDRAIWSTYQMEVVLGTIDVDRMKTPLAVFICAYYLRESFAFYA